VPGSEGDDSGDIRERSPPSAPIPFQACKGKSAGYARDDGHDDSEKHVSTKRLPHADAEAGDADRDLELPDTTPRRVTALSPPHDS